MSRRRRRGAGRGSRHEQPPTPDAAGAGEPSPFSNTVAGGVAMEDRGDGPFAFDLFDDGPYGVAVAGL